MQETPGWSARPVELEIWDQTLRTVFTIRTNVYESIQSQAMTAPLALCKWVRSIPFIIFSIHNPIGGVWAVVKCPVAVLITSVALLHLWPTFIKWATCVFLDVITVRGDAEQRQSVGYPTMQRHHMFLYMVLVFNATWLTFRQTKNVSLYNRCCFQALVLPTLRDIQTFSQPSEYQIFWTCTNFFCDCSRLMPVGRE